MLTSNNQCSIKLLQQPVFDSTQPPQQTQPTTSVARPNKKCWTAHNWAEAHHWTQRYSLNNWISHWYKFSSFRWTTLIQDTLDITGAGYEYDLYDYIPVILFLYSERIQHRFTTVVWLTGVQRCEPPPWLNANWAPISLIFQYSVLFWFSISCFSRFSKVFGLLFSGDFGF